jgi:hypothetical protein
MLSLLVGYYHELFLRGKRDICRNIRRRQVKGTGTRKPDAPESEPNFYLMEFLPESKCTEDDKKMPPKLSALAMGNNITSNNNTLDASISLTGMMTPSAVALTSRQPTVDSSMSSSWFPSSFEAPTSTLHQQQQHQQQQMNLGPLIAALHSAGSTTPQAVMLRAALASLTSNQPLTSSSLVDAAASSLTSVSAPSPLNSFQGGLEAFASAAPGQHASFLSAFQTNNTHNRDLWSSLTQLPPLVGDPNTRCLHGQGSNNSTLEALAAAMQSGARDSMDVRLLGNSTSARYNNTSSSFHESTLE